MYQVLLVDDEPWVLLGLANSIPWGKLGLRVCAQTTDPTTALNIILDQQPDIVITDIRMPNVSGIDLMCYSREQGGNCDFILFSGYSDFEFAKRAIQYGIFAYLLKPLNQKEFIKTLTLLVKNIETRRYTMREQSEGLFFDDQIQIDPAQFPDGSGPFCVLTCYITYSDKILLDNNMGDFSYIDYRLGSNKYVYLFRSNRSKIRDRLESLLKLDPSAGREYLDFGLSSDFTESNYLKTALHESNIAAHSNFLFPDRRINEYRSTNIACCNLLLHQVYAAIDSGSSEQVKDLIEYSIGAYCRDNNLTIQDFSYIYNRILAYMEKSLQKSETMEFEYLSYNQLPQKFSSFSEATRFLNNVLQDISDRFALPENKSNLYEAFERMLVYINGNFSQEISLSELSSRFYINMTYICDLFKRYKSTTFSKYLTKLRLEKAHHMICTTQTTLSEISESVGYRDYYYFIKQFKKKYNITPGQLRKENPS